MSNCKSPISFKMLETADGSPTLSLNDGEKMHSMQGAFAESLYIYGELLKEPIASPRILSVGLGLGYNEIITFAHFLKKGRTDFTIESYESVEFLTQALKNWIQGNSSPLQECYENILHRTCEHFAINKMPLLESLRMGLKNKTWTIKGELPLAPTTHQSFQVILYDAYSSETNQELWSESHFDSFIPTFCDPECCHFTTYAATGALNRSLKRHGFTVLKRPGFGHKRESTQAHRVGLNKGNEPRPLPS